MKAAVVIGRFQPVHNGHMKAIEALAKTHDRLFIVIGSSQYRRTHENPLSGGERKHMLAACLHKRGLLHKTTLLLVRDEHDNARWTRKVRLVIGAGKGFTAYSNNPLVRRLLKPYYRVRRLVSGIELNSTQVRDAIRGGREWKELVPKEAAEFLERHRLVKAITGT